MDRSVVGSKVTKSQTQLSPGNRRNLDKYSGITSINGVEGGGATPFSRDLPDLGIEPRSPMLEADSLPSEPPGTPIKGIWVQKNLDELLGNTSVTSYHSKMSSPI